MELFGLPKIRIVVPVKAVLLHASRPLPAELVQFQGHVVALLSSKPFVVFGRLLEESFANVPDAGKSLQFSTEGGKPGIHRVAGLPKAIQRVLSRGLFGQRQLAVRLGQLGNRTGLLDADIYGPSIPLMLNVSGTPEVTPDRKIVPRESYGLRLMSIGFLVGDDGPVIWRGPMVHGVVQQFLSDVLWGELDYLVIDLPPGTGDAALTLCQTAPLSGAVIVTTPQEVSLIDARKGLKMFERVNVPVLGIAENMSYFLCPSCDARHHVFGTGGGARTADELKVPLVAQIPLQPDVVDSGDTGKPTVGDIPADLADEVEAAIEQLTETVAMTDDDLVEKYLEEGELSPEDVRAGLSTALKAGAVMPVLLGSATRNIGIDRILA